MCIWSRRFNSSRRSLLDASALIANGDAQLLSQDTNQTRAVPEIDPVADGASLLARHVVALDDPVKALGTGYGAAEPDLLVWWLLVQNVGSGRGKCYVEDSCL